MLTTPDYLKMLAQEPEVTFFYDERPVLYVISHNGDSYVIALIEALIENRTERFLLLQSPHEILSLLQEDKIGVRDFFYHPSHRIHDVLIEYAENIGPVIISGETYEDNASIPDEYLPIENEPLSFYQDLP